LEQLAATCRKRVCSNKTKTGTNSGGNAVLEIRKLR
jgi:hypothetical protein